MIVRTHERGNSATNAQKLNSEARKKKKITKKGPGQEKKEVEREGGGVT